MKYSSLAFLGALLCASLSTHVAFAQGAPTNFERIKYIEAARNFEKTAEVAPTAERKFDALISVGDNYAKAHEFEKAMAAYEQAGRITPLSSTQQAKLRLGIANTTFERDYPKFTDASAAQKSRELYDAYLKMPDIETHPRDEAHRKIASIWNAQGDAVNAALQLEKIGTLVHYHGYHNSSDYKTALIYLQNAKNKKPSATTSALIDRLYATVVAQEQDNWKVFRRNEWADLQLAYGAPTRAYVVWVAMADDAQLDFYDRASAIRKIAEQRIKEKQPELGLKAWERTAKWPAAKAGEANWKLIRANSRAQVYQTLGDETAVRNELAAIPKLPRMDAREIASAEYNIAQSHRREIETLKKTKPSTQLTAAQLPEKIAAHEKAVLSLLTKIVKTKDAGSETRYQAAMRYVEMESAHKRYEASNGLVRQLFDEWSKSDNIFDDMYLLSLAKVSSQLYAAQNKYSDAVVALDAGLKVHKKPDTQASDMMLKYYNAAFALNDWEQSRSIQPHLRQHVWSLAESAFQTLLVETNAENWPVAAAALLKIESSNFAYTEEGKNIIAAAKARIPADAVEKAQANQTGIE